MVSGLRLSIASRSDKEAQCCQSTKILLCRPLTTGTLMQG